MPGHCFFLCASGWCPSFWFLYHPCAVCPTYSCYRMTFSLSQLFLFLQGLVEFFLPEKTHCKFSWSWPVLIKQTWVMLSSPRLPLHITQPVMPCTDLQACTFAVLYLGLLHWPACPQHWTCTYSNASSSNSPLRDLPTTWPQCPSPFPPVAASLPCYLHQWRGCILELGDSGVSVSNGYWVCYLLLPSTMSPWACHFISN